MNRALLVHDCDRDGLTGFLAAIPLPDQSIVYYEDAVKSVKDVLSKTDFVNFLIKNDCLDDDLFQGFSYKFVECLWSNYQLVFRFKCIEENLDELDVEEYVETQKSVCFINIF